MMSIDITAAWKHYFYLHKVLKNLKIKLDKGYVIYNYFTDKCQNFTIGKSI